MSSSSPHSHHYYSTQNTHGHSAAAGPTQQLSYLQNVADNVAHSYYSNQYEPYPYGYPSPEELHADISRPLPSDQQSERSPPSQYEYEVSRDRVTINNDVYRVMNNPALGENHGNSYSRPQYGTQQSYPPRLSTNGMARSQFEKERDKPFHGIAGVPQNHDYDSSRGRCKKRSDRNESQQKKSMRHSSNSRRHIYTQNTHHQCQPLPEHSMKIKDFIGVRSRGANAKAEHPVMMAQ